MFGSVSPTAKNYRTRRQSQILINTLPPPSAGDDVINNEDDDDDELDNGGATSNVASGRGRVGFSFGAGDEEMAASSPYFERDSDAQYTNSNVDTVVHHRKGGGGGGTPRRSAKHSQDSDLTSTNNNDSLSNTDDFSDSHSSHVHSEYSSEGSSSTSSFSDRRRQKRKSREFWRDALPHIGITGGTMAVPILFLLVVSVINLSEAIRDKVVIGNGRPYVVAVSACNSRHMAERGQLGPYVATGADWALANLTRAQVAVDTCRRSTLQELRLLTEKYPDEFAPIFERWTASSAALAVARQKVMSDRVQAAQRGEDRDLRMLLTNLIQTQADSTLLLDRMLIRPTLKLKEMHAVLTLSNYLGYARGVGNAIAFRPLVTTSPTPSTTNNNTNNNAANDLPARMESEYLTAHQRATLALEIVHAMFITGWEQLWTADPLVVEMWAKFQLMATPDGHLTVRGTAPEQWWPVTSAGIRQVGGFFNALEADFSAARESNALVRDELIKISLGVVVCVLAALLLAAHQTRLRRQMARQITTLGETKRAIAAFVPRAFLSSMGYTSITQVQPGDRTETALTMLFSDIRRFTTVAEGMANTELFDWVQQYFAQMSRLVEKGRGNINQFIGDALFAVFKTSRDACLTAVAMQGEVERLNITNRCKENAVSVPVEIGVGIHQDCVALGVLGDAHRHTCTMISKSVNLASRLEGLTKILRCRIIASDAVIETMTQQELEAIRSRCLGAALVKGSLTAEVIHEIYMADEEQLQRYKTETKSDFEEAVAMFAKTNVDPHLSVTHVPITVKAALQRAQEAADERREALASPPMSASVRLNTLKLPASASGSRQNSVRDHSLNERSLRSPSLLGSNNSRPPPMLNERSPNQTQLQPISQKRKVDDEEEGEEEEAIVGQDGDRSASLCFLPHQNSQSPADDDELGRRQSSLNQCETQAFAEENGPRQKAVKKTTLSPNTTPEQQETARPLPDNNNNNNNLLTIMSIDDGADRESLPFSAGGADTDAVSSSHNAAFTALLQSLPPMSPEAVIVRRMLLAQRRHQVADETFLRILLHHQSGKTGMVFNSK